MRTPSEELGYMILKKLVEEKYIICGDVEKLTTKMATGKMKSEDWKLAIEKSAHKKVTP